ncbi:hypothetical protein AbraIFM66950_007403 [Aspergillus brasiliensis]|nr:hypothetical protein AbraIFM66950_007403 [Aspergillus brasiliensis]
MANDELPANEREWKRLAGKYKMKKQSLRMNVKLHSASSVSYKQYLLFRTILPPITPMQQLNPWALGITPAAMNAATGMVNSQEFRDYLTYNTARLLHPGSPWAGDSLFRLPAIQQQQAIAELAQPQQRNRQWDSRRRLLKADFGTPQHPRQYVAYTDGQLEDLLTQRILALVECKANLRRRHAPAVDMQEVAQLVAWVKQNPGVLGADQRVLLSKDGTDLYISVFEYDQGWLRYLNGGPGCISQAGFAYMRRYGPWSIRRANDMKGFAKIVIALLHL